MLAIARAMHLASLMTLFGATGLAALLQRQRLLEPPHRSTRAVAAAVAIIALVSGLAWFCLIAGQMSGSLQGSVYPATLKLAAFGTRFGQIFMVRTIAMVGLCLACIIGPVKWPVPVLAGLLLASLGPVSHAAAAEDGSLFTAGAASDAIHLVTGGFWLGGLILLSALMAKYRSEPGRLVAPLRVFSLWGSMAVLLLVATGVANALLIVPIANMTLRNPYFALLLAKVALAALMVGLAGVNRWRLAPALPETGAARRLASTVAVEMGFAFAVVAIVGYLGTMPPY